MDDIEGLCVYLMVWVGAAALVFCVLTLISAMMHALFKLPMLSFPVIAAYTAIISTLNIARLMRENQPRTRP